MHSVRTSGSSHFTPIKMKQKDAKPTMNGRYYNIRETYKRLVKDFRLGLPKMSK